ncbi:unnamed protein product, partial [Acanthoscelides obtectus]
YVIPLQLVDLAHAAEYFVTQGNDEGCQYVEVLLMWLELTEDSYKHHDVFDIVNGQQQILKLVNLINH